MYNTYTKRGYLDSETSPKDQPSMVDSEHTVNVPKIFVLCDQGDTAPVWGYILRQQGLNVIIETSVGKLVDRWSSEMPDLLVIDIDTAFHLERLELHRKIRAVSAIPVLLLLPAYHENQILESYAAGVDEVVVKPVSPPVFLAKIMAWVRRSWVVPTCGFNLAEAGRHKLIPTRRCLIGSDGQEIHLSNLEYRLLQQLISHPAYVFPADDLIQMVWGEYGRGDEILLKNVIYRLRRKIEMDPSHPMLLKTEQGGYSFQG